MEYVLSCVDANGDLDMNLFSTPYSQMFAKDIKECFDLFKTYQTVYHQINKGVNDVRKQLKMYITREKDRRESNSRKRSFVPPCVNGVISGGIKECLYDAYKSTEGTASKRPKKGKQSISSEVTDQSIEGATVTPLPETLSLVEVPCLDQSPSPCTHACNRRPIIEPLTINDVSDKDGEDEDYEVPKQRRRKGSDVEKINKKMQMMRERKKEKRM